MIHLILQTIYLLLPAYFANMAPVIVKDLNLFNFLAKPLDFNKKINKKPVLGAHKTFRGLIFAVIFAVIITYIQFHLQNISFFKDLSILDYSNWLSIGFLLGIGAITGDSVKSFFKRRFNIKPGKPWIPFDQTDFIIGALLFISIIYIPELKIIIAALVVSFILHITVSHIAYYLKLRKVKL